MRIVEAATALRALLSRSTQVDILDPWVGGQGGAADSMLPDRPVPAHSVIFDGVFRCIVDQLLRLAEHDYSVLDDSCRDVHCWRSMLLRVSAKAVQTKADERGSEAFLVNRYSVGVPVMANVTARRTLVTTCMRSSLGGLINATSYLDDITADVPVELGIAWVSAAIAWRAIPGRQPPSTSSVARKHVQMVCPNSVSSQGNKAERMASPLARLYIGNLNSPDGITSWQWDLRHPVSGPPLRRVYRPMDTTQCREAMAALGTTVRDDLPRSTQDRCWKSWRDDSVIKYDLQFGEARPFGDVYGRFGRSPMGLTPVLDDAVKIRVLAVSPTETTLYFGYSPALGPNAGPAAPSSHQERLTRPPLPLLPLPDYPIPETSKLSGLFGSAAAVRSFFQNDYGKRPSLTKGAANNITVSEVWLRGVLEAELGEEVARIPHHQAVVSWKQNGRSVGFGELLIGPSAAWSTLSSGAAGSEAMSAIVHGVENRPALPAALQRAHASLEDVTGSSVGLNLYISAPEAVALPPHTDRYDVIVIQTTGAKRWRVCTPSPVFSNGSSIADAAQLLELHRHSPLGCTTHAHAAADPDLECNEHVMEPGDVLYLPKGVVHSAVTASSLSVHVTASLRRVGTSWADLFAATTGEQGAANRLGCRDAVRAMATSIPAGVAWQRAAPMRLLLQKGRSDQDAEDVLALHFAALGDQLLRHSSEVEGNSGGSDAASATSCALPTLAEIRTAAVQLSPDPPTTAVAIDGALQRRRRDTRCANRRAQVCYRVESSASSRTIPSWAHSSCATSISCSGYTDGCDCDGYYGSSCDCDTPTGPSDLGCTTQRVTHRTYSCGEGGASTCIEYAYSTSCDFCSSCPSDQFSSSCGYCSSCRECAEGTFASGGCSGERDTTCSSCTTACPVGEYMVSPCSSTADMVCRSCDNQLCEGDRHRGGICEDTLNGYTCHPCGNTTCPNSHYQTGECGTSNSPVTNGYECMECDNITCGSPIIKTHYRQGECQGRANGYTCALCETSCPLDQYIARRCNGVNDTICEPQTICEDVGAYETSAPTPTTDRRCTPLTQCFGEDVFEGQAPTPTTDRSCETAGECSVPDQYESVPPTTTTNRQCRSVSGCVETYEFEVDAPTPTTNRVCSGCDTLVCAVGRYRSGSCTPESQGYTCESCDNTECTGENEVRSGSCGFIVESFPYFASATENGYVCGQCANLTCNAGEFQRGECPGLRGRTDGFSCHPCADPVCPEGEFSTGVCVGRIDGRFCEVCSDITCDQGSFRSGSCSEATGGAYDCITCANSSCPATQYRVGRCTSRDTYQCRDLSPPCPAGTNERSAPSPTADRTCDRCPGGTFSAVAGQPTCVQHTTCYAGTFAAVGATSTSDRTCYPCPDGQHQDSNPFRASDSPPQCADWQACRPGMYQNATPTPTSDRGCLMCPCAVPCEANPFTDNSSQGHRDWTRLCRDPWDTCTRTFTNVTNLLACVPARRSCPASGFVESNATATSDVVCSGDTSLADANSNSDTAGPTLAMIVGGACAAVLLLISGATFFVHRSRTMRQQQREQPPAPATLAASGASDTAACAAATMLNPMFDNRTYDAVNYDGVDPSAGGGGGAARNVYAAVDYDQVGAVASGEASVMQFPNRQAVEAALLADDSRAGTFCVRSSRTGSEVLSVVMSAQTVVHFELSWVS